MSGKYTSVLRSPTAELDDTVRCPPLANHGRVVRIVDEELLREMLADPRFRMSKPIVSRVTLHNALLSYHELTQVPETYTLDYLHFLSGTGLIPSAPVQPASVDSPEVENPRPFAALTAPKPSAVAPRSSSSLTLKPRTVPSCLHASDAS